MHYMHYTRGISRFITQTDLRYVLQPVLHMVTITIWSTCRRTYLQSVCVTNLDMPRVLGGKFISVVDACYDIRSHAQSPLSCYSIYWSCFARHWFDRSSEIREIMHVNNKWRLLEDETMQYLFRLVRLMTSGKMGTEKHRINLSWEMFRGLSAIPAFEWGKATGCWKWRKLFVRRRCRSGSLSELVGLGLQAILTSRESRHKRQLCTGRDIIRISGMNWLWVGVLIRWRTVGKVCAASPRRLAECIELCRCGGLISRT
jgi:hypothetical protein